MKPLSHQSLHLFLPYLNSVYLSLSTPLTQGLLNIFHWADVWQTLTPPPSSSGDLERKLEECIPQECIPVQLGRLQGAELKIAKLKLALEWESSCPRALLQAVDKMTRDFLRNTMHSKHQNKVQNRSSTAIDFKSMCFYI